MVPLKRGFGTAAVGRAQLSLQRRRRPSDLEEPFGNGSRLGR